jgi:hypothetical protein
MACLATFTALATGHPEFLASDHVWSVHLKAQTPGSTRSKRCLLSRPLRLLSTYSLPHALASCRIHTPAGTRLCTQPLDELISAGDPSSAAHEQCTWLWAGPSCLLDGMRFVTSLTGSALHETLCRTLRARTTNSLAGSCSMDEMSAQAAAS